MRGDAARRVRPGLPGGLGKALAKFTREEAAVRTGVERVAALPTGCLLVDLRAFDLLPPPWFHYEYADPPFNTALASTEDVVCTRNADWVGVPQYCAWDCWAAHVKTLEIRRPRLCPVDSVPRAVWDAWRAGAKPKLISPYATEPAE